MSCTLFCTVRFLLDFHDENIIMTRRGGGKKKITSNEQYSFKYYYSFAAAGHVHETDSVACGGIGIRDETRVTGVGKTRRRRSHNVSVHHTRLSESQNRYPQLRRLQDIVHHR